MVITSLKQGPQHIYQDGGYTHYGVQVIANHPNGYVVTAGGDYHTKIWHPGTLEVIGNFHAKTHHDVTAVAVSHNGNYLATGHGSWGGVHLWNIKSGKLVWAYEKLMYIKALAFDARDSRVIALSGPDRRYHFDLTTGERVVEIDGEGACDSLVMQTNAARYFSAKGKVLTAHETRSGKTLWRLAEFTAGEQIEKISILPGDDYLAVVHGENQITFVKADDGAIGHQLTLALQDLSWYFEYPLALTPDLKITAIATDSGQILFYRTDDGRLLLSWQIDETLQINTMQFSSDGKRLILGDGSYERGYTFILDIELETDSIAAPFEKVQWQRTAPTQLDKFILDNDLQIVSGYYHNEAFLENIQRMDVSQLQSIVEVTQGVDANAGGNFSNILKAVFDRALQCNANALAGEAAILMLRDGLPSAGAVAHDAWGMMAYCAQQACDYLSAYPLDSLSEASKARLRDNIKRAIAVNDDLDDISITGLNELSKLLIVPHNAD